MIRQLARFLIIPAFSLCCLNIAHASSYDTCLKWVIDGIGVHCNSRPGTDVGAILFFKKMHDSEWRYQSANTRYPYELVLNGPGLQGGAVTEFGRDACNKFCDKYTG